MITAVRIKNLRSLADTDYIEIKPITLLLGANSSGKSTFLRSFPLFTQSVNKALRGPISWFDDSLVDFGDYNTAKNKYANDMDKIQFYYDIETPFTVNYIRHERDDLSRLLMKVGWVKASFSLSNDNKGTYISSVNFKIDPVELSMSIADRNGKVCFAVNGEAVTSVEGMDIRWNATSYENILPSFDFNDKIAAQMRLIGRPVRLFYDIIISFVKERSDKRLQKTERVNIMIERWGLDKEAYLSWLKRSTQILSFRNYIQKWTVDNEEYLEFYNLIALHRLMPLWDNLDAELTRFYATCSYIAPTRAEANRYYRTQGLQVNDIDPYGKNLQEFISSLSAANLSSYNTYMENTLGIRARTETKTGHQSIMVKNDRGEFNITDVGFGYSQILPIVTKLWYTVNKRKVRVRRLFYYDDRINSVILMEQPELHLHPAYQAKIADAFVNAVTEQMKEEDTLRLIIETHSDTILNRIGRRVREGKIHPEDVNIILFEKKPGEKTTQLRQTTFNQNGQIKEWPYGFFDPLED